MMMYRGIYTLDTIIVCEDDHRLCVCVCVCLHVCVCVYACMCVCLCPCTHNCMRIVCQNNNQLRALQYFGSDVLGASAAGLIPRGENNAGIVKCLMISKADGSCKR